MNPEILFKLYYDTSSQFYQTLFNHCVNVTDKAVAIARALKSKGHDVDVQFVYESAMLHDIGMIKVHVPRYNPKPEMSYIAHGYTGAQILRAHGFPKHALVAERHVGCGISSKLVKDFNVPIPVKDYYPETLEEKIVSYADLFYSKSKPGEHTVDEIIEELKGYDKPEHFEPGYNVKKFKEWHSMFSF